MLGRPLAGSAATARHPPTLSCFSSLQASEQDQEPQNVLSVLNALVTPELLETGAECVASNSLGRNTTIIFLELGKGRVLQRGGAGLVLSHP